MRKNYKDYRLYFGYIMYANIFGKEKKFLHTISADFFEIAENLYGIFNDFLLYFECDHDTGTKKILNIYESNKMALKLNIFVI